MDQDAQALDARTDLQNRLSARHQNWHAWLFQRLSFPPECRLLEIGSGTGRFWLANVQPLSPGWHVTLSDKSATMVVTARKALASFSPVFTFALADGAALPIRKESLDGLLAIGVLDSLADIPGVIIKIHSVLKPGGRLYAATGAQDHLGELCSLVSRYVPGARLGSVGDNFTCENGERLLSEVFPHVRLWEFRDVLTFSSAEEVLVFIQTEKELYQALLASGIESFMDDLAAEFRGKSGMQVTAHKVLFEAVR